MVWIAAITDGSGSGSRVDAAAPALALAVATEDEAKQLTGSFTRLLRSAGGMLATEYFAHYFEATMLPLAPLPGEPPLPMPDPAAIFAAWNTLRAGSDGEAEEESDAKGPAASPGLALPLPIGDSLYVTFPPRGSFDWDAMRAAGVGREAELEANPYSDVLWDPSYTVADAINNVEATFKEGPGEWLYKLRTSADGDEYEFFTFHGVGDDEAGSLQSDLLALLSVPAILAASGATALSGR